jgi:hypothetical protein
MAEVMGIPISFGGSKKPKWRPGRDGSQYFMLFL